MNGVIAEFLAASRAYDAAELAMHAPGLSIKQFCAARRAYLVARDRWRAALAAIPLE